MILRDINNKILTKHFSHHESTLFIHSDEYFNISVFDFNDDLNGLDISQSILISDDDIKNNSSYFEKPIIYQNLSNDINNQQILRGIAFREKDANKQYTIYLGKTQKKIRLIISRIKNINDNDNDINEESYQIIIDYKPLNILLSEQEHYSDLLTNYNLPNIEELNSILIDDNHKYDSIKRLLLEYRNINKHKGKLKSIEKFLHLIGFNPDSIKLFPEYLKPNNSKTINPDKTTDIKTGYYHVIFDNWEFNNNNKYTLENLPNIKNTFKNYDNLFDKLLQALTIAHNYFTIKEQELSFFGINIMVNNPKYLSIASNMTITYYIDTLSFKKDIDINISNLTQIDSYDNNIVKNNIQIKKDIKLSEIKYYKQNPINYNIENNVIFFVDKEIRDNENDVNLTNEQELLIQKDFGNIINIKIKSKGTRFKYKIFNSENELIKLNTGFIESNDNTYEVKILFKEFGIYNLVFEFYDYHGNRESFEYTLNLTDVFIDFDIFDSTELIENNNLITQDISSPSKLLTDNDNSFDMINNVSNLDDTILTNDFIQRYYEIINSNNLSLNHYTNTYHKMLSLMNKNNIVSKVTETLITKYIDNFLNIITLRKLNEFNYEFDSDLFVKEIDINIDNKIYKYYFVTTKSNSINISQNIYDIKIKSFNNQIKYDIKDILNNELLEEFDYVNNIIPVNYDFELFENINGIGNDNNTIINSLYPRLTKDNINFLKIGDIIVCKINENLITNNTDLKWEVRNSFTKEILHKSNDYVIKFRVDENVIYDINLELKINGKVFTINKNNIKSSFVI